MRFLIHEMPFERPLAAGKLRYEQAGVATGAVESWRLTQAAAGYRFLRVDLDGRASSGDSYLYHLTLTDDGQPERLNFRFWNGEVRVGGNVTFDSAGITITRIINGQPLADELPGGLMFCFPAALGLALPLWMAGDGWIEMPAFTLSAVQRFAPRQLQLYHQMGQPELLRIGKREMPATPHHFHWLDQQHTIWLDASRLPLKMEHGDLIATETRWLRYEQFTNRALGDKNI